MDLSKAANKALYYQTKASIGLAGFAPVPGYYLILNTHVEGRSTYAWANWKPSAEGDWVKEAQFKFNLSCLFNFDSVGPKKSCPITSLVNQSVIIKSVIHKVGYLVEWDTVNGADAHELTNGPNYAFTSTEIALAEAANVEYALAEASADNYDADEDAVAAVLSANQEQQAIIEEINDAEISAINDETNLQFVLAENFEPASYAVNDEEEWPDGYLDDESWPDGQ